MSLLIALVPMIAWGSIGLVSGKIGGSHMGIQSGRRGG